MKGDKPAYPRTGFFSHEGSSDYDSTPQSGMTKRQVYAKTFVHAFLTDPQSWLIALAENATDADIREAIVFHGFELADAMIAFEEKEQND